MNGLRASALRQVEDIRACGGQFPLTPALSLGERVTHSRRGKQSRLLSFPLRDARCSLSLRERVRVRGNGANYHLAYRAVRANVELGEYSCEAGGFQDD